MSGMSWSHTYASPSWDEVLTVGLSDAGRFVCSCRQDNCQHVWDAFFAGDYDASALQTLVPDAFDAGAIEVPLYSFLSTTVWWNRISDKTIRLAWGTLVDSQEIGVLNTQTDGLLDAAYKVLDTEPDYGQAGEEACPNPFHSRKVRQDFGELLGPDEGYERALTLFVLGRYKMCAKCYAGATESYDDIVPSTTPSPWAPRPGGPNRVANAGVNIQPPSQGLPPGQYSMQMTNQLAQAAADHGPNSLQFQRLLAKAISQQQTY